jgi:hypothetical protein
MGTSVYKSRVGGAGSAVYDQPAGALLGTPAATATLAAQDVARGYPSVIDYGAKCDAKVLTGVSIAASSTSLLVPGGHGLTSADVGKSVSVPLAGAARDLISPVSAASGTSITTTIPATRTVSGATGAVIVNGSAFSGKVTGTLSIAAGSTALTDSTGGRSYVAGTDQMAVLVQGAWSDALITTIAAVPDNTHLTLTLAAATAVASGAGKALVYTDNTVAVQAFITANVGSGKRVVIPDNCAHGPVNITGPLHLEVARGATIYPIVDPATVSLEKLYNCTGDKITLEGIQIAGDYMPFILANNKYLFYGTGCKRLSLIRCGSKNIPSTDGNICDGLTGINSALKNILVVHSAYLTGVSHFAIAGCTFETTSGAAIFLTDCVHGIVEDNTCIDQRWYPITVDRGGDQITIRGNKFTNSHPLGCYWGGFINLMSQIGGARNKRIFVYDNHMTGIANYGAGARLLSLEDSKFYHNTLDSIQAGAYGPSPVQYIGMDTRLATGSGDNGPCKNVEIYGNTLRPKGANQTPIYIKNAADGARGARDPALGVSVHHNWILSASTTDCFDTGISVHGIDGGFDGVSIHHNRILVVTRTGSVVGGAIGLVSTNVQGKLDNVTVSDNYVEDLGTPVGSTQLGLFIQTYVDNLVLGENTFKNFFYGVRTLASTGPTIAGMGRQKLLSCTNSFLLGTAPSLDRQPLAMGADVGNAAKTLTVFTSEPTQLWNTPLTAARAVTLSTTNAFPGARFRIVRGSGATGAFNLNIGTGPLIALGGAGQFADVEYSGSAWAVVASGYLSTASTTASRVQSLPYTTVASDTNGCLVFTAAGTLTMAAIGVHGEGGDIELVNDSVGSVTVVLSGGSSPTLAAGQVGVVMERNGKQRYVAANSTL